MDLSWQIDTIDHCPLRMVKCLGRNRTGRSNPVSFSQVPRLASLSLSLKSVSDDKQIHTFHKVQISSSSTDHFVHRRDPLWAVKSNHSPWLPFRRQVRPAGRPDGAGHSVLLAQKSNSSLSQRRDASVASCCCCSYFFSPPFFLEIMAYQSQCKYSKLLIRGEAGRGKARSFSKCTNLSLSLSVRRQSLTYNQDESSGSFKLVILDS